MKTLPSSVFSKTEDLIDIFFQMVYSLYVAHTTLKIVHYDIKCLNFFLKDTCGGAHTASAPEASADVFGFEDEDEETSESSPSTTLQYGFAGSKYTIPNAKHIVKLADFGTASMPEEREGGIVRDPITVDQVCTVENTPLDFYICGSEVRQGPEADVYALGLCFVHLVTGGAPYEETFSEITCPEILLKSICKVWKTDRRYEVVSDALGIESKTFEEDAKLACDTIYRIIVMFGWKKKVFKSPVADAIDAFVSKGQGKKTYEKDQTKAEFSKGTIPALVKARAVLKLIPGGMELLKGMVALNGASRVSLEDALKSNVFEGIRTQQVPSGSEVQSFMHFF